VTDRPYARTVTMTIPTNMIKSALNSQPICRHHQPPHMHPIPLTTTTTDRAAVHTSVHHPPPQTRAGHAECLMYLPMRTLPPTHTLHLQARRQTACLSSEKPKRNLHHHLTHLICSQGTRGMDIPYIRQVLSAGWVCEVRPGAARYSKHPPCTYMHMHMHPMRRSPMPQSLSPLSTARHYFAPALYGVMPCHASGCR
jgi:hypothetical protein